VVVLVRGPATLSADALTWDTSVNTPTLKRTKLDQLRAVGVIDRVTA
jgi:hypothetical protein